MGFGGGPCEKIDLEGGGGWPKKMKERGAFGRKKLD